MEENGASLAIKEFFEHANRRRTSRFGDGCGERNFFRANGNAILSIPARRNPTGTTEFIEPFVGKRRTGGMVVEQHRLADRMRANEARIEGRFLALLKIFF